MEKPTADEIYARHFQPIEEGKATAEQRAEHIEHSHHYDSPAYQHLEIIQLSWEQLRGRRVLSIGGEIGGSFEKEGKAHGVDVVTINPTPPTKESNAAESNGARAFSQELPFADNTFDYELAVASVPAYLPNFRYDHESTFNEMYRTCKSPGKLIFAPINELYLDGKVFQDILTGLKAKGATVDFAFIQAVPGVIPNDPERIVKIYRMTIGKP